MNVVDGKVKVFVKGGILFYVYDWSIEIYVDLVDNLLLGIYIVIVMDVKGCIVVVSVEIIENILFLALNLEVFVFISCKGGVGVLNVVIIGGKLLFVYVWSNGVIELQVVGLVVGVYQFMFIDVVGIMVEAEIILIELVVFFVKVIVVQLVSMNNSDGVVKVIVIGGIVFYIYVWSIGSMEEQVVGLLLVIYQVIVMDVRGCMVEVMVVIFENIFLLEVELFVI